MATQFADHRMYICPYLPRSSSREAGELVGETQRSSSEGSRSDRLQRGSERTRSVRTQGARAVERGSSGATDKSGLSRVAEGPRTGSDQPPTLRSVCNLDFSVVMSGATGELVVGGGEIRGRRKLPPFFGWRTMWRVVRTALECALASRLSTRPETQQGRVSSFPPSGRIEE